LDNAISAAVKRFSSERERYQRAAEKVAARVHQAADEAGIACLVTARAKDVRSFHKKILAKGYTDPWRQLTDKAGVRAVVHQAKDVDRLLEQLRQEFGVDVLSVEDKRQVIDPTLLAYSGIHVQVVAEHATEEYEVIECEVQLRTAAQDAWSIVSHQVLYKPLLELPAPVQHSIYRLVALVELFDEEVQRVMDLIPTLPGAEVLDLLDIAESRFLALAHSPSNKEVSILILQAVADSIDVLERKNYAALLDAFIESERDNLTQLFEEYGPHSVVSYVPSYLLFGQAESLILLERLTAKPHALVARWREGGLPDEYLEALAGAAGIALPD
jgi:ppGpp synthetase/RelA/SpoT-type nucleotidyltranferase